MEDYKEYEDLLSEIGTEAPEAPEEEVKKRDESLYVEPLKRKYFAAVKRNALRQTKVSLSDKIGDDNLKAIIKIATEDREASAQRYADMVNNKIRKSLIQTIPQQVMTFANKYPHLVVNSPGFLWEAEYEGKKYKFWAQPDNLPYYHKQGTEQNVIETMMMTDVPYINKYISRHFEVKREILRQSVKLAKFFYEKNIQTYYDLLKNRPALFDKMFKKFFGDYE